MNQDKKREMKNIFPVFLMGGLFVVIDALTLLVIRPFEVADIRLYANPNDPMNIVSLFVTLVVFTAAILLIAKFWKRQLIQGIILGATGYLVFFVSYPLLTFVVSAVWSLFLSIMVAAILVAMLVVYPEWYVIDVCSILIGVGVIAMFGISLSIFLVIVLLIGLAAYDAISVYRTKHMITLADTILDLKLPTVLVIPKFRAYSLIRDTKSLKEKLKDGEEREAFVMGLGDFVFPGILVASTFYSITSNGLLIALSVMLGTLFGFVALMRRVNKGNPQAGLPYLCSGAILGYVVSSYILFGELVGLTFPT
jgi:presenilin-like A22 family membrane protease